MTARSRLGVVTMCALLVGAGSGCGKRAALSNYNLGLKCEKGDGMPKDEARAAALFKLACDGGEMRGCSALGEVYEDGNGVVKDEARAAALLKQACDGGEMGGCKGLGEMYANGTEVPEQRRFQ
jgi:uncharacterized protein